MLSETSAELRTDIEIAISELVSNVVEHARSGGSLAMTVHSNGSVLVEVSDPHALWSEHPAGASLGGRGLGIVDAVADEWDIEWTTHGKTVWAWFGRPVGDVVAPLVSAGA